MTASATLRTLATVGRSLRIHRLIEAVVAPTATGLTLLSKGLGQPGTDLLAGHLNQTQRCHLSDLMTGTVASQTFSETTHQKLAVSRQHHVNKVNDDNSANIAQP